MSGAAIKSPCGNYRYWLARDWTGTLGPGVLWIMLNPSTADASQDDPTIRAITRWSKSAGYPCLEVVNLFAWRSPYPEELKRARDPIGPDNDEHIRNAAKGAATIICAWGANGNYMDRDLAVRVLLDPWRDKVHCLGRTKAGQPRHPLYLATASPLERYL